MTSPETGTSQRVTLAAQPGEEPVTVTATVVKVERRAETSFVGRLVGLDAHLDVLFPSSDQPDTYFLSRLYGEPCWVQDAHFGPNGFPYFSNGFGARYLKMTGIALELEALLDQAALERRLVKEIGPEVPLVLAETDASQPSTSH
ncbi:hypothetical protein LZ318_30875 [Saccharopolyspora indica]|uniref:hypothetical protein n=1 Tax=Saccharopolyspora indica TaxID=1229659 RepID=UPI0022EB86B0|nr:hypothetical protein [Saccharopolyspora indica]MDA3644363.1 hypothetical protein [Saccharopolyspora indica]